MGKETTLIQTAALLLSGIDLGGALYSDGYPVTIYGYVLRCLCRQLHFEYTKRTKTVSGTELRDS